jgi:thiol-disulfide isomerase/thioredoxin
LSDTRARRSPHEARLSVAGRSRWWSPRARSPPIRRTGCGPGRRSTRGRRQPANGIAWHAAANDAEVDAAFALAKAEHKPVFVYWGAKWCPPCNQVKATLFNRVDFIERSRAFVPVYIDGDSPGAQKLGSRFKVRGYPTMVLFNTDGAELTRLPGEVDAQQYTQVLTLGMNAQRPVKSVLADAKKGGAGLTANDWRLLAFYSWETDEQQVPPEGVPALLKQLAAACPADRGRRVARLLLKSLAARDEKGPKPDAGDTRARARAAGRPGGLARADGRADQYAAATSCRRCSADRSPERTR